MVLIIKISNFIKNNWNFITNFLTNNFIPLTKIFYQTYIILSHIINKYKKLINYLTGLYYQKIYYLKLILLLSKFVYNWIIWFQIATLLNISFQSICLKAMIDLFFKIVKKIKIDDNTYKITIL